MSRASAVSGQLLARLALIGVAVEFVVSSIPALIDVGGLSADEAHEPSRLASFTIGYAVALLVAAVRPARASTIVPVAGALAGSLVLSALTSAAQGGWSLAHEFRHLPELVSFALVSIIAGKSATPSASAVRVRGTRLLHRRDIALDRLHTRQDHELVLVGCTPQPRRIDPTSPGGRRVAAGRVH
jgi:hypothetical protein